MTRQEIISEIRTFKDKKGSPYISLPCTGGKAKLLGECETKQLFAALMSMRKRKGNVEIGPVIKKQLEFNLI